jgi:hypothetical protein
MALDFSNYDSKAPAEAGATIDILSPATGDPLMDGDTPVTITILGIDSAKLRGIARRLTELRINNLRKGKNDEFDAAEAEAQKVSLLAAATLAWSGIGLGSTEPLECNEKNAKILYSDPRFPWLVEQIDKAIADRQRFFKKASSR